MMLKKRHDKVKEEMFMIKNRLNEVNAFMKAVENMIAVRDDKYKH
jgi:hypothetical protein